MGRTKNKQSNCPHLQVEHGEEGKLVCASCDEVIFNPSLEPPTSPPPRIIDRFKPKKKIVFQEKKEDTEFIGLGLSCPHCNKHIEVAFR